MDKYLLRDQAYRLIKRKIVSLEYAIGSPLVEHEVCTQLGIGRTPVREALQRLAAEKLIKVIPRKGIFVSDINAWELDRLLEARMMIEIHCAKRAAELITREQIDHLRALFLDAPRLIAERKFTELLEIDRNFHMGIVAVSDNPFFDEMADKIYDHLARTWFLSFSRRTREQIMETVDEHLAIIESLEAGRPDLVERSVVRHLESFRARVGSPKRT
jgi:DNA-binding GntR family transcriptional regulator